MELVKKFFIGCGYYFEDGIDYSEETKSASDIDGYP